MNVGIAFQRGCLINQHAQRIGKNSDNRREIVDMNGFKLLQA